MTAPTASFARSDDALWRATHDHLALALADGRQRSVSGPGASIWRLLGSMSTIDEIAHRLAADYGAPVEEVAADVSAFLASLVDAGFVSERA